MNAFRTTHRVKRFHSIESRLRHSLDVLVHRFCSETSESGAWLGQRCLNDNTFFPRLAKGGSSFNIRTYDRVVLWLSENWPEGTDWPEGVARPEKATVAA